MIYWAHEQILSAVDAGPSVSAPPVAARLVRGGPSGVVHPQCGLATGPVCDREGDSVEGRTRPASLPPLDDGRAAGVRVLHGGVLVASHRASKRLFSEAVPVETLRWESRPRLSCTCSASVFIPRACPSPHSPATPEHRSQPGSSPRHHRKHPCQRRAIDRRVDDHPHLTAQHDLDPSRRWRNSAVGFPAPRQLLRPARLACPRSDSSATYACMNRRQAKALPSATIHPLRSIPAMPHTATIRP